MPKPEELDIYTRMLMKTPSLEHIIHNFLGGKLESYLLDEATNKHFGRTIDKEFADALRVFIVRLDLRSHRDKLRPPSPIEIVNEEDDTSGDVKERWFLKPGGEVEQTAIDPKITIDATAPDKVELGVYIRGGASLTEEKVVEIIWTKLMRDKSIPAERKERLRQNQEKILQQLAASVKPEFITESKAVSYTMNLPIFSPASLRSIVKIACNYFAHHNRSGFLLDGCNDAREFVRSGTGVGQILLCDAHVEEVGELCHAIAFEVLEDHEVVGAVTLFGNFHFLVRIGNIKDCRDRVVPKRMYVVNQVELKTRPLTQEWSLPRFDVRRTLWDTVAALGRRPFDGFMLAVEAASQLYNSSKSGDAEKLLEGLARALNTLERNKVINYKTRRRRRPVPPRS